MRTFYFVVGVIALIAGINCFNDFYIKTIAEINWKDIFIISNLMIAFWCCQKLEIIK